MYNLNILFWLGAAFIFSLDVFFGKKFPKLISLLYFIFVGFFLSIISKHFNSESAFQFFGLYFVEFLLSIDHVFVFLIILSSSGLKKIETEIVLNFGILFAIISRVFVVLLGMKFVETPFVIEALGVFLIFTAIDAFRGSDKSQGGIVTKILSGLKTILGKYSRSKIIIPIIAIGLVDVIFALDSIPAALSFSRNVDFIVWANVLTLVGMKSVFAILSYMVNRFKYFKYAVGVMLLFVASKLIFHKFITVPVKFSVGFVVFCILFSIFFEIIGEKLRPCPKTS